MKVTAAFLLVFFALWSSIILATQFGIYQEYPIIHYLLALVGIFFLFKMMRDKFTIMRLVMGILSVVMFGFYTWWTLAYAPYDAREPAVTQGQNLLADLEALSVVDSKGVQLSPAELVAENKATLLVFYRGYW